MRINFDADWRAYRFINGSLFSSVSTPKRRGRATDAIYCFCRTPAYPARYISPTLLLLGVVCHVNFARDSREGGRVGRRGELLTHCHRPDLASSFLARLFSRRFPRPCNRHRRRAPGEMQICPTPMKGLTELPAINMLIVFESRDSGL